MSCGLRLYQVSLLMRQRLDSEDHLNHCSPGARRIFFILQKSAKFGNMMPDHLCRKQSLIPNNVTHYLEDKLQNWVIKITVDGISRSMMIFTEVNIHQLLHPPGNVGWGGRCRVCTAWSPCGLVGPYDWCWLMRCEREWHAASSYQST